ncbi:MAG: FKBP-type peptidyl-prolyl cis-trans isomerase [Muribaculaceae bacterium]|nr:FKBP-type peptidyl-prolyl cis-trans isomerase [Muribaculaceae bacterium]
MLRHIARTVCAAALLIAAACPVRVSAQDAATVPPDSVSVALGTVLGNTIGGIVDEFQAGGATLDRRKVAETALNVALGSYEVMDLMRAQTIVNGILAGMQPIAGVDSFDTASQVYFLNEAAARDGAVRTPSGVVFEVITEGEGPMPQAGSSVRVFYVGRLSDDTIFDATDDPVVFPLDNLTPGLAEGIRMMRPGGKYRVTIPAEQAYGEYGIPGVIPGRAALQFVVELIEVI